MAADDLGSRVEGLRHLMKSVQLQKEEVDAEGTVDRKHWNLWSEISNECEEYLYKENVFPFHPL